MPLRGASLAVAVLSSEAGEFLEFGAEHGGEGGWEGEDSAPQATQKAQERRRGKFPILTGYPWVCTGVFLSEMLLVEDFLA